MLTKSLPFAVLLFCPASVILFCQTDSAQPGSILKTLNSQLASGAFTTGHATSGQLVESIFAQIQSTPPKSFEPSRFSGVKITDFSVAGLLAKTAQIQAALDARDWITARDIAVQLPSAIDHATQAASPVGAPDLATLERQASGLTGLKRFLLLPDLAKTAYLSGNLSEADSYAGEILGTLASYSSQKAIGLGDAVHQGNIIEGRLALVRGDISGASHYLLAAGTTPGSPVLDSFGPNMALARDLLAKGQKDVVLEYLSSCSSFWKQDFGKLSAWKTEIAAGNIPDFGPNLTR